MKIADDTFLGNSECEWVKSLTSGAFISSDTFVNTLVRKQYFEKYLTEMKILLGFDTPFSIIFSNIAL